MMKKTAMIAVVFLVTASIILSSCNKTGEGSISPLGKPVDKRCGNGVIDRKEMCDDGTGNTNNPDTNCYGGTFSYCNLYCKTATASCDHYCGDLIIDVGEECDGTNLNNKLCADFPNTTMGTLSCYPDCTFDISGCVA